MLHKLFVTLGILFIGLIMANVLCMFGTRSVDPGRYTVTSQVVFSVETSVEDAYNKWVEIRPQLRRATPFVQHKLFKIINLTDKPEGAIMWDSFAYPDEIHEQLVEKGWLND